MSRADDASAKHRNGYNCCQAVACTFADKVGIDESLIYKMGEGFGAGMGTAGLVGPLAVYATMSEAGMASGELITRILGLYFFAPGLISLGIHLIMKKLGWIKPGDMKLGS